MKESLVPCGFFSGLADGGGKCCYSYVDVDGGVRRWISWNSTEECVVEGLPIGDS